MDAIVLVAIIYQHMKMKEIMQCQVQWTETLKLSNPKSTNPIMQKAAIARNPVVSKNTASVSKQVQNVVRTANVSNVKIIIKVLQVIKMTKTVTRSSISVSNMQLLIVSTTSKKRNRGKQAKERGVVGKWENWGLMHDINQIELFDISKIISQGQGDLGWSNLLNLQKIIFCFKFIQDANFQQISHSKKGKLVKRVILSYCQDLHCLQQNYQYFQYPHQRNHRTILVDQQIKIHQIKTNMIIFQKIMNLYNRELLQVILIHYSIIIISQRMSSLISFTLGICLIITILYQGFDIKDRLTRLNDLSKQQNEQYRSSKYPENLQKMCQEMNAQTEQCIKNAQVCIKDMGEFGSRNKEFEKQFQICHERNQKNNERNNELQKRLKTLQSISHA